MDAQSVEATIKLYLTEIRNRLDKAAGIGRAANACAGAGFHEKGLEVALDIEQLLYEATTLLNAADRPTELNALPAGFDREASDRPGGKAIRRPWLLSNPLDQTCCGQMMANSGSQKDAAGAEALFVENFKDFDHIVTPSGS